jgi:hypothetical protein
VVVETGKCPRKVADGVGHSELKFRRGRSFSDELARVVLNGESIDALIGEDAFFQASTRGGREIDKILEGQAVLRAKREKAGDIAGELSSTAMSAALLTGSTDAMSVGSALGLVSGMAYMLGNRLNPHADTRYWTNLPDRIFLWVFPYTGEANLELTVEYADASGAPLPDQGRTRISVEQCDAKVCVAFVPTPRHDDMPTVRPKIVKRKEKKVKKRRGG